MNTPARKGKTIRSLLLSLIILIFGILAVRYLSSKEAAIGNDWSGRWEVSYYYENEPEIKYEGTLQLSFRDTLSGVLEVYAPTSKRAERLTLSGWSLTGSETIQGAIVHTRYKIRGGYLRESVDLQLENPNTFKGRGRCLAFCAEGTEGAAIIWKGRKSE